MRQSPDEATFAGLSVSISESNHMYNQKMEKNMKCARRRLNFVLLILAFTVLILIACKNGDPTSSRESESTLTIRSISGKIDFSRSGSVPVFVVFNGRNFELDKNGYYLISDTQKIVSARRMSSDSIGIDSIKIVVSGDTLKRIPINSWDIQLPTQYVIERNISINNIDSVVDFEAVLYGNDSIVRVFALGPDGVNRSGYIYSIYDDSMYVKNSLCYSMFIRSINCNQIKFSEIRDVTAKSGDQTFDASSLLRNTIQCTYLYPTAKSGSNISKSLYYRKPIDSVFTQEFQRVPLWHGLHALPIYADYGSDCDTIMNDSVAIGDDIVYPADRGLANVTVYDNGIDTIVLQSVNSYIIDAFIDSISTSGVMISSGKIDAIMRFKPTSGFGSGSPRAFHDTLFLNKKSGKSAKINSVAHIESRAVYDSTPGDYNMHIGHDAEFSGIKIVPLYIGSSNIENIAVITHLEIERTIKSYSINTYRYSP
jgi:hypothetical protein